MPPTLKKSSQKTLVKKCFETGFKPMFWWEKTDISMNASKKLGEKPPKMLFSISAKDLSYLLVGRK